MKDFNQYHCPVFHDEVIEYFNPKAGQTYFDGTLGIGGHAESILKKLGNTGLYIGVDQDNQALALAKERLAEYLKYCRFVNDNYRNIERILKLLGVEALDVILLDLGVSSFQIDDERRGFSFRFDAPLDMRMNQSQGLTAFDIVNTYSCDEISEILKNYGEERFHKRIANRIVLERARQPIETTKQLAEIIIKSQPHALKRQRIHPATRSFQAIRIVVNDELAGLEELIRVGTRFLKSGGRLGIISFHSLEDRIVKSQFKDLVNQQVLKLIVKKPLVPKESELMNNSRARSAKFRIAERI